MYNIDFSITKYVVHDSLLSPYLIETQALDMFPVKPRIYDVCIKGCMVFMDDSDIICCECQEPRYEVISANNGPKKARATMKYLPL